jgi:hypothetical protein
MTYLAIAIALLIVAAIVAWDIWRSRQKRKAPKADDVWIGGVIGFSAEHAYWLSLAKRLYVGQLAEDIEAFTGRRLDPVVVVFRVTPIPLPGGGIAAGVYHSTAKGWDHAWIELYTWEALPHELLHHATGMEDTPEFRELLQRFESTRRTNG